MNDPLSELARKIRSKKLNKEEIENLKKEAIESKIERNRRIKKAIEIQRIIRGYLARKKFKILEDKININTIIEYLYEKKVKRIHKHSSQIISYFIYKYIERQRKIKTQLIEEFKIHCSDVIKAFIRGCILRKKIKSQLELIHNSKQKIIPYILSFKTRLILNLLCFAYLEYFDFVRFHLVIKILCSLYPLKYFELCAILKLILF